MSSTRNLLQACEPAFEQFETDFAFYLDAMDQLFRLQGKVGLEKPQLAALPEADQNRFKGFMFIVESSNTTGIGALRLFASGLFSDPYALLRMLYEAGALLHYGNKSTSDGNQLFATIFKSGLDNKEHAKAEWALVQKATREWEKELPDLAPLRQYINNYGAHLSREKIVLGNMGVLGEGTVSTLFTANYGKPHLLMGLDTLFLLLLHILEEYDRQATSHAGSEPSIAPKLRELNKHFHAEVRPNLQKLQN